LLDTVGGVGSRIVVEFRHQEDYDRFEQDYVKPKGRRRSGATKSPKTNTLELHQIVDMVVEKTNRRYPVSRIEQKPLFRAREDIEKRLEGNCYMCYESCRVLLLLIVFL